MAIISDTSFIKNVEKSLTIAHLTDLPLPFLVINNRLYHNASREQIYGIMYLDGTPLSVEDSNSNTKRFEGTPASAIVEYYEKIERLKSTIKSTTLSVAGVSPPLTSSYTSQEYQTAYNALFGTAGFFASPGTPLNATNIAILGDLFKELLNRSKGISL